MACGVCGDPGHNKRTHSAHEPVQGEALIDQPATGEPVAPTGADRAREALKGARQGQFAVPPNQPHDGGGNRFAGPADLLGALQDNVDRAKALRAGRDTRPPTQVVQPDDVHVPLGSAAPIELTGADPESGAPLTNVFDLDVVKTSDGTTETTSGFLARGGRLVGESGPEPITLEQARQMWPDRVVVEGDGSWSVEAITVQGVHGPGPSSEGGNQDTPIVTSDVDPGQSPERCAACDLRLTDGESFLCSDCVEAPPVVPGGPDVMVPHECEPAPDQVYFCRHCGADLMVADPQAAEDRAMDAADAFVRHGAAEFSMVPPEEWITVPWRTVLGPDEPIRITLPGVYDLTAEQYHDVNVTGDWLSNSDVKKILQTCPAQFQYDRWNGVRKTSDAFDFGHVWHARVLGKGEAYRVFEPKKLDGRTKEGRAQKLEVDECRAAGITPIYGDQFALIEAMAQAVEADPVAIGLMSAPGRQEVCLFWTETIKVTNPQNSLYGQMVTVKRRAMIDHLPDMPDDPTATVTLVDGKTADEVKPDDQMRKKIYDYGYHRQADTYAAGVEALFGRAAEVVFLFQSKKPPHLIVPVDLDTPAMLVAAAENRQVMEVWAECVDTGVWPGHTKGIATSGVPAWIERQFEDELVIG